MVDLVALGEFKPINGYDGSYSISSCGFIYSHKSKKYLKPFTNSDGYYRICLCENNKKRNHQVQRLVAFEFVPGYFEGAVVNHIDFDRKNNNHTNLEWISVKDNHSYSHANRNKATRESNSREWVFIFPNGLEEVGVNMAKFCRENNLTSANLLKTTTGERKHHKGFRARRVE